MPSPETFALLGFGEVMHALTACVWQPLTPAQHIVCGLVTMGLALAWHGLRRAYRKDTSHA
jgi:hypothetical protein